MCKHCTVSPAGVSALHCSPAGVLAALVQHLHGALLTEIGAVEGLLPTLVDLAIACGESHTRWGTRVSIRGVSAQKSAGMLDL